MKIRAHRGQVPGFDGGFGGCSRGSAPNIGAFVAALGFLGLVTLAVDTGAHAAFHVVGCPTVAITCIEATNPGHVAVDGAVLTFGEPFPPGRIKRGETVAASTAEGSPLPLQVDETASNQDGSLRYAILTTRVPYLAPGGSILIALGNSVRPNVSPPAMSVNFPKNYDLNVTLDVYAAQISQVTFGNREGDRPGAAFAAGEAVTLAIGANPADRYTITIGSTLAGGGVESLTRLAEAFERLINKGSRYRAYRIGEGGGFERLWITSRDIPGDPFDVSVFYGGKAKIKTAILQSSKPRRRYTASIAAALVRGKPRGENDVWLEGPLATEVRSRMPFMAEDGEAHPRLSAIFDVRVQADGVIATDLAVENAWAYGVTPSNEHYDVAVSSGSSVIFAQPGVTHFHHARWHKTFYWNNGPVDGPSLEVRQDPAFLIASMAVPSYDLGLRINPAAIADEATKQAEVGTGLMNSGLIATYMPNVGGRPDIGLLPKWDAIFLLTMDARAKAIALAQADAAGSAPAHYLDPATDLPVSLDNHPGIAMEFGGPHRASDALPAGTNVDTPWTIDGAHQPSLGYVAYLVTGSHYYLDELLYWASWDLGRYDPYFRDDGAGLVRSDELRGQAWTMRTIANVAYIAPDRHPMKAYFADRLSKNIDWYLRQYVLNPDNRIMDLTGVPYGLSKLGWIEEPYKEGEAAPWQNDFFSLVIGRIVEMGWSEARPLFDWTARFAIGRWTSEAEGYCQSMAPAYWLKVRTDNGQTVDSWEQLFRINWPDVRSCPHDFIAGADPDLAFGYVAISRATLAMLSGFGYSRAAKAYAELHARSRSLDREYASDPTWAITPRQP